MNLNRILTVGALGLGMSLGLQAQSLKNVAVGLNLVTPLDGLTSITKAETIGGFTADLSYTGMLGDSGVPFRTSLGLAYLPGKEVKGLKMSLLDCQLAGDVLTKLGESNRLHLVTGLSLNQWRSMAVAGGFKDNATVKGVKFGGRLGLDYRFEARWSASLLLQAVELGVEPHGFNSYNPSWIQFGIKHHF